MSSLIQASVSGLLQQLGLEPVPGGRIMGGPQELKITEETVKAVQALVGSTVTVNGDGSVNGL